MKLPLSYLTTLLLSATALQAEWKPVEGHMMTEWGRNLKPDAVWTEYPRPQFQREQWTNLNGLWSYAVTAKDAEKPGMLDRRFSSLSAQESARPPRVWVD